MHGAVQAESVERLIVLALERQRSEFRSAPLLTAGNRTAPRRQQTLRAALDWSYELLGATETVLFRRLSVFAGRWSAEGAEVVCGGNGLEACAVIDVLARLVDKSLVIAEAHEAQPRYRMLDTVRDYAREILREAGEEDRQFAALRDWCITFAERVKVEADPQLPISAARPQYEAELDNIRMVLGRRSTQANDAEAKLRLCVAVGPFWEKYGYLSEGRAWVEGALAASPRAPTPLRAQALYRAGYLALKLRDCSHARAYFEEALSLGETLGDRRSVALARQGLSGSSHDWRRYLSPNSWQYGRTRTKDFLRNSPIRDTAFSRDYVTNTSINYVTTRLRAGRAEG